MPPSSTRKGDDVRNIDELFGTGDEAVWITTDETDPNAPAFLCKHFDPTSVEFVKVRNRVSKPYRKLIAASLLDETLDRKLSIATFVEVALVDWKNVYVDHTPLAFDRDTAISMFLRLSKLYIFVAQAAADEDRFRPSDDAIKN